LKMKERVPVTQKKKGVKNKKEQRKDSEGGWGKRLEGGKGGGLRVAKFTREIKKERRGERGRNNLEDGGSKKKKDGGKPQSHP